MLTSIGILDENVPFGYLFSTLMVAVMLGSQTFRVLTQRNRILEKTACNLNLKNGTILSLTLAMSAGSFWAMAVRTNKVRKLCDSD